MKGVIEMSKRKLTPLGITVKKRLIELNKTQVELAKEVGTSPMYLNLILHGDRTGDRYLKKISRVLGLPGGG